MSDDPAPASEQARDAKIEAAKARVAELEAQAVDDPDWSDTVTSTVTSTAEAPPSEGADDPSNGAASGERDESTAPASTSHWWRRDLDSDERQRVMTELAIRPSEHWEFRFATMLTLSVVIGVMGLSADSAAVVIGAMLLAPLMTPVLAIAACIAMALFRTSLRALVVVVLATVGAVALSFLLAKFTINGELPREVTSRTAPDIRDLIVALGAGAAGAYATVRKDASSSLPGVAVAVALVPPLGVIGIALEAGNMTFARGATLLYTTNLVAVVFAGFVVFVITGFVPPRRLVTMFRRSATVALVVAALVVAIAVPLYRASRTAIERSDRRVAANEIVSAWLGPVETIGTPDVSFDDDRVFVRVTSFVAPIDTEPLVSALQAQFGTDVVVSSQWDKVGEADPADPADREEASDEVQRRVAVEGVVIDWLAQDVPDAGARLESLAVVDDVVRVDASGVGDAPSAENLAARLDAAFDRAFEVQLTWLERESTRRDDEPTPDDLAALRIADLATEFATVNGVAVLGTSFDGEAALVELAGQAPPDVSALVAEIEEFLDPADTVTVLFTLRVDISAGTSTGDSTATGSSDG